MSVIGLDHLQLAIPVGGEDCARAFYAGLLGFTEVPKPAVLAGRGGCWFESGAVRLHLGVETDFRPALKAHPAFLVDDLSDLIEQLQAAGVAVNEDKPLAGYERRFVADPFGNRVELMQRLSQD
jgi:catechol 2,3-dioxygenase-like lactoylglutathione lyase family enzyme